MSFQDPISDCLTRIRNGLMRGKTSVVVPFSQFKEQLINVLVSEGYLLGSEKNNIDGKEVLEVSLKYINAEPAIRDLKRISKPSLRRYSGSKNIGNVKGGLGVYILSTNKGLLTDKQAKDENVGGEVICEVF
tara:strand:+ start:11024 stop:11419 length:396 start_codon:yes stop_codon:yes gene_type:complete